MSRSDEVATEAEVDAALAACTEDDAKVIARRDAEIERAWRANAADDARTRGRARYA